MRRVVRCEHCGLNQFETRNGSCRRCHRALPAIEVKRAVAEIPVIPVASKPIGELVSEGVRAYRMARGWSQGEFEDESGITHSVTSRIETGGYVPSIAMIERLAAGLRVPIRWIFEPVTAERLGEVFAVRVLRDLRAMGVQHPAVLDALRFRLGLRKAG